MKKLAAVLFLLASPAFAQQQQVPASDRIAQQIGNLYIQVQQQQDTITSLQAELAKAREKLKQQEPNDQSK